MPPSWSAVRITPTAGKVNPNQHSNRAIRTRKQHGNRAKCQIEKNCRKSLDIGTATVLSSKRPERHGNRADQVSTLKTESRHGRNADPEKPATIPSSGPRGSKYSRTTGADTLEPPHRKKRRHPMRQ